VRDLLVLGQKLHRDAARRIVGTVGDGQFERDLLSGQRIGRRCGEALRDEIDHLMPRHAFFLGARGLRQQGATDETQCERDRGAWHAAWHAAR
jgi:hypothetical protein